MTRARIFSAALLAGAFLMGAGGVPPATAQTYPAKPIKIIVSTSAGGVTDLAARILGQEITAKTGQPAVIDNRAGGSGNIALEALARAEPDGYTIGVVNTGNVVINPYLFKLNFDPLTDLVPVAEIGTVPLFLIVNSRLPANNAKEFFAYVKSHPDSFSYASAGAGTTPDLFAAEFAQRGGVKFVFVPFRGTGPAVQAVLGGDVQATFASMGPHIELVKQGKLRVLGAATAKRVPYLPDVPTFAEQGLKDAEASTWFSVFAPRGTPPDIIEAINGYVREMSPDLKGRLEANFVTVSSKTVKEMAALVKADAAKWERIVKASGQTPK